MAEVLGGTTGQSDSSALVGARQSLEATHAQERVDLAKSHDSDRAAMDGRHMTAFKATTPVESGAGQGPGTGAGSGPGAASASDSGTSSSGNAAADAGSEGSAAAGTSADADGSGTY